MIFCAVLPPFWTSHTEQLREPPRFGQQWLPGREGSGTRGQGSARAGGLPSHTGRKARQGSHQHLLGNRQAHARDKDFPRHRYSDRKIKGKNGNVLFILSLIIGVSC